MSNMTATVYDYLNQMTGKPVFSVGVVSQRIVDEFAIVSVIVLNIVDDVYLTRLVVRKCRAESTQCPDWQGGNIRARARGWCADYRCVQGPGGDYRCK
jgi:hypothetical protein